MGATLGPNSYGKSGIGLLVVDRTTTPHDVTDLRVDIRLEGDFAAAHIDGDNAAVLPTDTMRGTVYAFARDGVGRAETFGQRLASHFVETVPTATAATVELAATRWAPVDDDHPAGFVADPTLTRTAHVRLDGDGTVVRAGVRGVDLLKTADSGFSGFLTDRYTTLAETDDRLLGTRMDADWGYVGTGVDWEVAAEQVALVLLRAFADHDSRSLQHTLYAMGAAVLGARDDVTDVHLLLPNRHKILADLSPYGLDNPNVVFVAADEPFGVIEATVARDNDPLPR